MDVKGLVWEVSCVGLLSAWYPASWPIACNVWGILYISYVGMGSLWDSSTIAGVKGRGCPGVEGQDVWRVVKNAVD